MGKNKTLIFIDAKIKIKLKMYAYMTFELQLYLYSTVREKRINLHTTIILEYYKNENYGGK